MSIAALRFVFHYPVILSLTGLCFGIWGALMIAFPRGGLVQYGSRLRILTQFLAGKTTGGYLKDSPPAFALDDEMKGWRFIIWAFVLQALATIIGLLN